MDADFCKAMTSGELLKRYRVELGLTQGQVAEELNKTFKGYTTAIISYIEHGKVELPQIVYDTIAVKITEKPFRNCSDASNTDKQATYPSYEKKPLKSAILGKEGKAMTQCERVINYINEFGSITTREAFIDLGVARLASRICDLTKQGYEFEREYESCKNRYGESTSYVRYSLKEKAN